MASPQFPQRTPPPTPRGVPLLALLGACLMVVLALQGVRLAFESGMFGNSYTAPSRADNPFSRAGQPAAPVAEPVYVQTPAFNHNLQLGSPSAVATLTVFTDPACGSCREKLARWLTPTVLSNVRLVYKFWPQVPNSLEGGLVLELARRSNLAQPLLATLNATAGDLDAASMFSALEASGMPLADQRRAFAIQSNELVTLLGKDIDQARRYRLGPPPQLVLDSTLIDGRLLTPSRLDLYIGRLFRNQPLVQPSDSWLNSGN